MFEPLESGMPMDRIRCDKCVFWRSNDSIRGYCYNEIPKIMLMPVLVDNKTGAMAKPSRLQSNEVSEHLLPTSQRPLTLAADFCREWTLKRT